MPEYNKIQVASGNDMVLEETKDEQKDEKKDETVNKESEKKDEKQEGEKKDESKEDKKDLNVNNNNNGNNEKQVATFAREVGVIEPPPDIKTIIDRTSDFVRRVGPAFEQEIYQRNAKSKKFGFLQASSPYHAYYQQRLKFGAEGPKGEAANLPLPTASPPAPAPVTIEEKKDDDDDDDDKEENIKVVEVKEQKPKRGPKKEKRTNTHGKNNRTNESMYDS